MSRLGIENYDTRKATASPSRFDLHWIAGFLEGEGCFVFSGTHGHKTARIVASQVQREPLERLQKWLGGALTGRHYANRNPFFVWTITGARARGVAMTIYPLMSPRRKAQLRATIQ